VNVIDADDALVDQVEAQALGLAGAGVGEKGAGLSERHCRGLLCDRHTLQAKS
jgi:hypothetical protein